MDNRHEVKPGDFFNMTREVSPVGNETWDNQNRFNTCVLEKIKPNGEWVYRNFWEEYSREDYPFMGSQTYWNLTEYGKDVLIQKISDPETEGFKDKKLYLKEKIENKACELVQEYENITRWSIISIIQNKKASGEVMKNIVKLKDLSKRLLLHNYDDAVWQYSGFLEAYLGKNKYPSLRVFHKGEWKEVTLSRIVLTLDGPFYMEINDGYDYYNFDFKDVYKPFELQPIDFAYVKPWDSAVRSSEGEWLAMRILRLTPSWDKQMTWEEYAETMTDADKRVSYLVKRDFDAVIDYLKSPESCALFSKSWKKLVEDHKKEVNVN